MHEAESARLNPPKSLWNIGKERPTLRYSDTVLFAHSGIERVGRSAQIMRKALGSVLGFRALQTGRFT